MKKGGSCPDARAETEFEHVVPAAWRPAWDSSPAQVTVTMGAEHLLAYQNGASKVLFGTRRLGVPMTEAFPELPQDSTLSLDRVLRTGETVDVPPRKVPVPDVVGRDVLMRYVLAPVGEPAEGVVCTAIDVTAEVRAEQAMARTQLVADIATRMTAAKDAADALRQLTEALVPVVADLAAVYVIPDPESEGDDPLAPALPPEVLTLSPLLESLGPLPPPEPREGPSPWDAVLRAGTPIVVPVNEATLPALAPRPESLEWLTKAAARSLVAVPLVVAGTLTGALLLLATADREPFADSDLPFLTDVTARAGLAISQLRTARQHRDIALRLQEALLPPPPPPLPGMTVAARYIAGAPQVQVGGDWWDVHHLGGGRVAVGIGDVSGRGIASAAVMGQASAAMRAASHAELSPAGVLTLLDRLLVEVIGAWGDGEATPQFATACYAVVEPQLGLVRAANAGHLPLLVRGVDGQVRVVELPTGPPLGLGIGGFVQTEIPIRPGETLVMCTDGLVESRSQDIDDGIADLAALIERLGGEPDLDRVADELLADMGRRPGHGPDDVALVLLRIDADS